MALSLTTNFKVNVETLRISKELGVVDQGNINVSAPADFSETGDANLPAVIGTDKPVAPKRKFVSLGPGSTLAERMGTEPETVSTGTPEAEEIRPTAPIDVPGRIVPVVNRQASAKEMGSVLTPKFMPMEEPAPVIEAATQIMPAEIKVPEAVRELPAIKADLKGLVLTYIQKNGPEASARFFGKPQVVIHNWVNGRVEPPVAAVQAILDKSPKAKEQYLRVVEKVFIDPETGEGSFQRDHTKEELPIDLCLCTNKDLPPYVHWVFVTAAAQYGLGEKMQTDTILPRARNMCADMFLNGKAQWSIWLDYDVLPTIGNAPWWRAITRDLGSAATVSETTASYDFIKRLLAHNKPFVGGVYATRRKGGPLVTQLDLHPRNEADKIASDKMRKNRASGLYGPVEWLSTGFAIVHRVVFETIKKNHPEWTPKLKGEPYPFFTQLSNEGEDVAFCKRAVEAGFKLFLDQELFAAHIGRYPFLPGESAYNGPMDITNAYT